MPFDSIKPQQRVRVRQSIRARDGDTHMDIEGVVVSYASRPTGSWYAHGKDDKYWLPRLRLRRDDGELVDFALDDASQVQILNP